MIQLNANTKKNEEREKRQERAMGWVRTPSMTLTVAKQ